MKVFTLLYSRSKEDDLGNFLFFETFRVGFPDAELFVFSNANTNKFNKVAEKLTHQNGGEFFLINKEIEHHQFISFLIQNENKPFYLIDPDTIWFDKMPKHFDSALAGRFIPRFYDLHANSNTFERLHTSCLYISPKEIKEVYERFDEYFNIDYLKPLIYYLDGKRYRFDTASQLYQILKNYDLISVFDESINEKFCHLFCGSHVSLVSKAYPEISETHNLAIKNVEYAKNLKKKQDLFFLSRAWI